MSMEIQERALLVAMPLRHLEPARARCEADGSAVLPAGGPGDLDAAPPGVRVLIIATDAGDSAPPAVTWRATFEGRIEHTSSDRFPPGLPETWLEEHAGSTAAPSPDDAPPLGGTDPEDQDENEGEDDPDDEVVGPQSFFRVSDLAPMSRSEWIYSNELVPKQERGGRTFVPRTPRLIVVPD